MNIDKEQLDFLLNKSETFCALAWTHVTTTPSGFARTCCISTPWPDKPINLADHNSVQDIINSEPMKLLRLDMLNNIKNSNCANCYEHEQYNIGSMRQDFNKSYRKIISEPLVNTEPGGHINDFKLKYYDFRLNNICNMKCRTCCSANSSLWEIEDAKQGKRLPVKIDKQVKDVFLNDVINNIEHLHEVYFAGGEPLIMEEHYIILEELIRKGHTDVKLRYNTNLSVLKYKDKDILDLWSKFDEKVYVSVSLDHFGDKAEYIRNGTKWADIEKNMSLLHQHKNVTVSINTVLSVFNFLTLPDFYRYIINKGWYSNKHSPMSLYMLTHPTYLDARILSPALKKQGLEDIDKLISYMKSIGFSDNNLAVLEQISGWVLSIDQWSAKGQKFKTEIERLDKLRLENFVETFPELKSLLD